MVDALHARRQRTRDLVVDRVLSARDLLRGYPLAALEPDQDRALAAQLRGLLVRAEVGCDAVHADGADERMATAAEEHVGVVRQRTTPAVAVADREHAHERVLFGDEASPVADALALRAQLHLGDVGLELERRLQSACRRVLAERVHAVDRDAAAHHVELRLGRA
jgi:hypothetical protein